MAVKAPIPTPASRSFWKKKSIEQLAAEQGVRPLENVDELFGAAANLWADDADFEEFMKGIAARRHELPST
jgi:hypothetical protein